MEHQLVDPSCLWVLNPHSLDLIFVAAFTGPSYTIWVVKAFAIKAPAAGQTRTWLDGCLEVHGIALIHKGFALELWIACYFPTDGNGTVLVWYQVLRLADSFWCPRLHLQHLAHSGLRFGLKRINEKGHIGHSDALWVALGEEGGFFGWKYIPGSSKKRTFLN